MRVEGGEGRGRGACTSTPRPKMQSSKCITNKQLKNGSHSDSPSLSHFCPLPLCLHLSRMISWVPVVVFHLSQLHRHAGCGMMGHGGAMAALSHPSSFCRQTHNEWRPRQLNHHRHNVGYDHDDYDVSPYDHHDLRYTGDVLLLCGWGLWPAAGGRCGTCLPLVHARLHLSMMHQLLGDWTPPSWPWPRSSGCK